MDTAAFQACERGTKSDSPQRPRGANISRSTCSATPGSAVRRMQSQVASWQRDRATTIGPVALAIFAELLWV